MRSTLCYSDKQDIELDVGDGCAVHRDCIAPIVNDDVAAGLDDIGSQPGGLGCVVEQRLIELDGIVRGSSLNEIVDRVATAEVRVKLKDIRSFCSAIDRQARAIASAPRWRSWVAKDEFSRGPALHVISLPHREIVTARS